ncbi:MAG: hypothetical protein V4687_06820 [Bacteroidota bacterium]
MASTHLEDEVIKYATDFHVNIKKKKSVAVVCGAEYLGSKNLSTSGNFIAENGFYLKLKDKLLSFGKIGENVNGSSVGCCAEVNASNDIYISHSIELKDISLSKAYRPRTMQVKEKCHICKSTFY